MSQHQKRTFHIQPISLPLLFFVILIPSNQNQFHPSRSLHWSQAWVNCERCNRNGTGIKLGEWPCAVCGKGVDIKSTQCTKCQRRVHKRCGGVKCSLCKASNSFVCSVCLCPTDSDVKSSLDIDDGSTLGFQWKQRPLLMDHASYYLVKHCLILIIVGRLFLKNVGLKWWFQFPHHLTSVFYTTWGNKNCKFVTLSCIFSENSFLNMKIFWLLTLNFYLLTFLHLVYERTITSSSRHW